MAKISKYTDGSPIQATDKLIVARNGKNYYINGLGLSGGGSSVNMIHNGGFQISQRGNGPFTSASSFVNNDDSYLLDGCIFLANGSDTCDISRVADGDFVSGYKIRLDVETANRRFGIFFPIEGINCKDAIYNAKASLQFKVKVTGSSISNVRAYILSWTGTEDTITSDCISAWGSAGSDPTFAANWTSENVASNIAVTTTTSLQKVEGVDIDTSGVKNIGVLIIIDDTDAIVGDYLEVGDVKLEASASCTDYKNEDIQDVLLKCLRYFEMWDFSTSNASYPPIGIALSTTNALLQIGFFPKRNAANNVAAVGTIGNLLFQSQVLATFTAYPRLPNFMIAVITTAGSWTSGAAGFLGVGVGVTTYLYITNEL